MPFSRLAVRALLVAACFGVLSACSHHGPAVASDNLSGEVLFTIENDLNPPAVFSVYVVGEDGTQHLLGTLPSAGTQHFSYRPVSSAGRFRLVARIAAGRSIGSEIFTLKDAAVVTWRMRSNAITIAYQE